MKKYILISILLSGFLAQGEVAFARGSDSLKSLKELSIKARAANTAEKQTIIVAQNFRPNQHRRTHRPLPPSRKIHRAQVIAPIFAAGVLFRTGAQIILPGHPALSAHYPYRINGVTHQRWPSHCSYILGYAQQRTLPPEWTVEAFNGEVIFCRDAYFPTLPIFIEPPEDFPPTVVPPPVPQRLSFNTDANTCRNLAYEATKGGPGLNKTVEGGIVGGALGAAAGAAIGAVTGNPGQGAAIGAAAGGIGGATINNIQASKEYKTAYANCMRHRGHEVLY